jgi:hypothetical protein
VAARLGGPAATRSVVTYSALAVPSTTALGHPSAPAPTMASVAAAVPQSPPTALPDTVSAVQPYDAAI